MKVAGLDIGSTGCKCTVFDHDGTFLGNSYRDYPVKRDVGGDEIDVSAMMDAVYEVLHEMASRFDDIGGIGVTSFGETFVLTDREGVPLCPSMLYTDSRGKEECDFLVGKLDGKHMASITGLKPHEMYSISKLMWMKNHEKKFYDEACYAFLMEDFVVFHLTGKRQIDYSLATRTMAFDITSLGWSREIFDTAGIDMSLMSSPVPTGTPAGTISHLSADKTGLSLDCQIVSISHDQVSAAVGAGAFDSSVAVDGAGTVECVTPIYDELPDTDVMYEGSFSIVPYVIPGKYVTYAFLYTGGALIQWCIDNLAGRETELAKAKGCSVNNYLEQCYASEFHDDPSRLLVLPHFAGAATPYMDTGSKGAILGLGMDTKVCEIYRALMEGIAYEMKLNIQALSGSGLKFNRILATGGGAHSSVWMQLKADVLGFPLTALETVDAGTVGSAMLTGVATGLFKDLYDAAGHMVKKTVTYRPREEMHEKYQEIFKRYALLYQAVRPLM